MSRKKRAANSALLDTFSRLCAAAAVLVFAAAEPAHAQTDYYNTDSGRPLTIEDAAPTERYAFELQLAPIRLERMRGGIYQWEVEPELAYGILPRTQIEIAFPLSYRDAGGSSSTSGLAGISLSALHNLNTETSIPALAFSGKVLLPAGGLGPDEAVFSAKAIATRTFRWARFHVNGEYSFGADDPSDSAADDGKAAGGETLRWLAGIAVDKTFPLRSFLVGAEIFARKTRSNENNPEWNAALGVRRQLSPAFSVDAGIGRQLSGGDRSWFATLGIAHAFTLRSLLP